MRTCVMLALLLGALSSASADPPAWKSLPAFPPEGQKQHTGSYTIADRSASKWHKPPFVYNEKAVTGRKLAKVIVLIYDPVIESAEPGKTTAAGSVRPVTETGSSPAGAARQAGAAAPAAPGPSSGNGVRLTELIKANDPVEYSYILANVIREASWGYINYQIVDVIRVDNYPIKVDGFRYTDESFLEVRRTQQWQPATSSYRGFFTENNLLDRFRNEGITELWVWGASGMHFDEFAFYMPNRYARFGPTDNEWLYRPYDIPEELGRTTWVMGFNYEVGADNMIHSYTHRVESMAALAMADGQWDPKTRQDPWNVFSRLEMDFPGEPSQVGNCHVPPNGQKGYDYDNKRRVLSFADNWASYPDVARGGPPRLISATEWGSSQFGYQKWILEHVPKFPGFTAFGYNNWWVYIGNTDEDLLDLPPGNDSSFSYLQKQAAKP